MITQLKKSRWIKVISIALTLNILALSSVTANDKVTLNAGTSIILETTSLITSDALMPGELIDFRVKYDVVAGEEVVIAAGTIAKGQITRSQQAKGLGKPGYVEVQINSVTAVDGQTIPLTGGDLYQEGEDKQTEAIILGVLICILFLTMKGKNAIIPAHTEVSGITAGTVFVEVE
ncbi:MAG: hypothetical protein ACOCWM_04325 [Cyclobacteriaceae bacterium]